MERQEVMRGSGILLAVSSLPSEYGIGTLGKEAFAFVDLLADLKQKYWQVLPIGPTSFGDSPYQSLSAFAGNPYLIDLDTLAAEGLLRTDEIQSFSWGRQKDAVDYAALFKNRSRILRMAYERFDTSDPAFARFSEENQGWVEDYALYMALKESNENRGWQDWEKKISKKQPVALAKCRKELYNDIRFWVFCQFKFFEQWQKLKEYANGKGIRIIGDVPFYVGLDSADTWLHPEQFLLDESGRARLVAAAIPDKFSGDGQVWGTPLYNWQQMSEDGFAWWKARALWSRKLYDVIRMDHFIGFVKSYAVPADSTSASGGRWLRGPGRRLTGVLREAWQDIPVIADDYGGRALVPGAKKLLAKTGWLGTRVLMFAFDGDPANEHLPHNFDRGAAVYAGTHDNETVVGYFREKTDYELAYLYEYLGIQGKDQIADALIRCAYSSVAELAVIQMQDLLGLGNTARMNEPATVGRNWRWRLDKGTLPEARREWIRTLAAVYRR